MAVFDDDDRPKKKIAHEIGQDLGLLSVAGRDPAAGGRHGAKTRETGGRRPVFQALIGKNTPVSLVKSDQVANRRP